MRILSVDDNPVNLKLLRAVLEAEGYDIIDAVDGVDALAILEAEDVDVIISDILMPNMDGYELCYEVRKNKKLRHLPFIAYTSTYTSPSDERFALEVGADKYLRKPAQATILVETIKEFASNPAYRRSRSANEDNSASVMQSYSKILVDKLQEKNLELEQAKAEIMKMNEALEQRVRDRTNELELANQELEAFCHSAAHDLRSPLRAIDGYGYLLQQGLAAHMGAEEADYVDRIRHSAKKMNALIDDLLELSYVGKCEIAHSQISLSHLVNSINEELASAWPGRQVKTEVQSGVVRTGDSALLEIALQNILSNAWKFTANRAEALVDFGTKTMGEHEVCFVRDNGAGFDMDRSARLFNPFERMHTQQEFIGTGLGLTIVKRILSRHGGQVWLESAVDVGTTVYFRLPF